MSPEEQFAVVGLEPDKDGRPGWGLRDVTTGELVTCADGEVNRFWTPGSAEAHRQTYYAIARREEDTGQRPRPAVLAHSTCTPVQEPTVDLRAEANGG